MIDRTWQTCVLPLEIQLNLAMPCLASNDQKLVPAFSFWPYLTVQVMTNTCKHNLAMTRCASNDGANNRVLPQAVQLKSGHSLPCKYLLWTNDQGRHRPLSFISGSMFYLLLGFIVLLHHAWLFRVCLWHTTVSQSWHTHSYILTHSYMGIIWCPLTRLIDTPWQHQALYHLSGINLLIDHK